MRKIGVWSVETAERLFDDSKVELQAWKDFIQALIEKRFGKGTTLQDVVDASVHVDLDPEINIFNQANGVLEDTMIEYNGVKQKEKGEYFRLMSPVQDNFILGYYHFCTVRFKDGLELKAINQSFGDGDASYILLKQDLISNGFEIEYEKNFE